MSPSEFTIDFYKKCLSQHRWDWRNMTNGFDRQKHSGSEDFLLHIATTNGQPFIDAFNAACPHQNFPVKPAEKPKTNTIHTMQVVINIPEFAQLAEAINKLTAVLSPTTAAERVGQLTETATSSAVEDTTPTPAPKKRGRKAASEEAVITPEPTVETPEPVVEVEPAAPALPELTGAELASKASQLLGGDTPIRSEIRAKLVDFRNNTLGWTQPVSKMTDQAMLYQFNEKIDELAEELARRESEI